jgi:hypothetical protein
LLKFVSGGRNAVAMTGPQQPTNLPVNWPSDVDKNKMAVEADPGPFKAAAPNELEAFVPVLVIVPEANDVNIVLFELSPVDVCHREKLQLDNHSMTHLSSVPNSNEMRQGGHGFQFCSANKDFMSDSFALLHGATNETVAAVMDLVVPTSHCCSAHFKLLGHHGDCQERQDSGDQQAGGLFKLHGVGRPWCM